VRCVGEGTHLLVIGQHEALHFLFEEGLVQHLALPERQLGKDGSTQGTSPITARTCTRPRQRSPALLSTSTAWQLAAQHALGLCRLLFLIHAPTSRGYQKSTPGAGQGRRVAYLVTVFADGQLLQAIWEPARRQQTPTDCIEDASGVVQGRPPNQTKENASFFVRFLTSRIAQDGPEKVG